VAGESWQYFSEYVGPRLLDTVPTRLFVGFLCCIGRRGRRPTRLAGRLQGRLRRTPPN